MAIDPNSRRITIGFPGGYLSGTKGLLTALFGAELVNASMTGTGTVSRKAHGRVRVIGGSSTNVAATTFGVKKFPSGRSNGGAGGEAIKLFVNGDWWTARLGGSHQDFNDWLQDANWSSNNTALWKSERGTTYGPFTPTQPLV
jgi:hypothetical protein